MSSRIAETNRQGADGTASTPTSYHLRYASISSNAVSHGGGFEYDITDLIAYFEIYESLDSPSLEVILSIGDGINLMEKLRLSGSETISLHIKRTEKSGQKSIKLDLIVAEIFDYVRLKPGLQTYNIRAVSNHLYVNNLIKLNRPYTGSPTDAIRTICNSELNIRNFSLEGTSKSNIRGIFPNIRPLEAIKWLMTQAFDDGTPYFFYQTMANDGRVNLRSYRELLSEDVFNDYKYTPFVDTDIEFETPKGYEYERETIRELTSDYGQSKLTSAFMGAYSSKMHTLDIANKAYNKTTYQYKDSLHKLNKHNPFSSNQTIHGNVAISDHLDSKNYFVSLNEKSFEDTGNYMSIAPIDLQKAAAYLENLNYQTHKIQIAGDFEIKAGDKIKVQIRKAQEDADGSNVDKLQSGIYIITEIQHIFKKGFYQYLTIQKDSSEVNLDAAR